MGLFIYKKYVRYLRENYHSLGKIHGNIRPEYLMKNGGIQDGCDDKTILIPFRHPDILISGKTKTKYHDYYALFSSVVYLLTGKIFNSPDNPITDNCEMFSKIYLFISSDLQNLKREQKVIEYLYALMIGDIIA